MYKAPLQYCLSLVVSQLCSSALPYPHTSHHHPSYHSHLTPPPPQLSLSPHTATTPAITLTSHYHHPSYHSHLTPSPPQLSLSSHTVTPAITHLTPPLQLSLSPRTVTPAITLTSHRHHPSYHSHLIPPTQLSLSPHTITTKLSLSPHTVTIPAITLTSHHHHPSESSIPPHILPSSVITLTAHPHHPKSSLTSPSLTPPGVNVLSLAGRSSEICGEESSALECIQQQEGNDCLGNRDPPCKGNNRILPTCVTTHLYVHVQ